jgi:hypothetical protein
MISTYTEMKTVTNRSIDVIASTIRSHPPMTAVFGSDKPLPLRI